MIYLVTVHDRKKRVSTISSQKDLETHVWKSILDLTFHKSILYPIETFNTFKQQPLSNRVNIVFSQSTKRARKMPNVLVNNNYKDIVSSFSGTDDDVYIIGSTKEIVERFAKDADFIVDYSTEELGYTNQSIFDTINFADYTLLKKQDYEHYTLRYFVREDTNFIGY